MSKNKHLNLDNRHDILTMLKAHCSFRHMARELGKSPNCISQEVKNRRIFVEKGCFGHRFNNCLHRRNCPETFLCRDRNCNRLTCSSCKETCCSPICPSYEEELCPKLDKAPFVCDGCQDRGSCTLRKAIYLPGKAHEQYEKTLKESRQGFCFSQEEIREMDQLLSPSLKRGLSPHVVWQEMKDEILCSERTLYRLIAANQLSADNFDLPFKLRYKPRKKKKGHKVDSKCRVHRSLKDFKRFLEENPDAGFVEMDTVEGRRGGKCLLSIYLLSCDFHLLFLREKNNSKTVIEIFNWLYRLLGRELFMAIFPIILTDNGSEFTNPNAIEFDENGQRRTRIFYCDPGCPNQKPNVEGAHKHLRRILPKGSSFDHLTQKDINLVMANLNGFKRRKLNNHSPKNAFSFLFGEDTLRLLEIPSVPFEELCLSEDLLR